MSEMPTSVEDDFDAPDDIFSGNLYVELPSDQHWGRRDQRTLRKSCAELARRYPAIREAARSANVDVEQFLLDTMFTHLLPAQLSLAKLTYPTGARRVHIDVALRLSGDARPGWPLPKGVSLVAKGHWQLQWVNRKNIEHINWNPALTIFSFHEGPPGDARTFEVSLNVECLQTVRLEPGTQRVRNVLTRQLADAVPAISELTGERLKDWSNFLEWKRRVIQANREALRFTSREIGVNQRSVVFRTVGSSEDNLRRTIGRMSRSDNLAAVDTSISEDEWVFQLPAGEREPRGSDIGRKSRASLQVKRMEDTSGMPWDSPAAAEVTFSLSEEALESIDSSEEQRSAVDGVLSRIPESGFIVQSTVQDWAQIDRQAHALALLSDQGGNSPYLARYIFDAAEARTPSSLTTVDQWVNTRLNAAQRSAVQKVLSAPDLCLIQGPPGTGKTTVIAEAIVQVAQRHESVLLASQTHTAVDNALSRLPFHPSIRAVRLTRNEDRVSEEGQEFINERALGRYYRTLASAVQSRREEALDQARFADEFAQMQGTASMHIDDLDAAERRLAKLTDEVGLADKSYVLLARQFRDAHVQVEGLDDIAQGGSGRRDLTQSLAFLRSSLQQVERLMHSVVDGRPPSTGGPSSDRRGELNMQLAEVLERMKVDASAVSEYQRLQAELSKLGEDGAADGDGAAALRMYFPDAAWLLEEPANPVTARFGKRKRSKAANDILDRIRAVRDLLPQLGRAQYALDDQTRTLHEAELHLSRERENVHHYFTKDGRDIFSRDDVDPLPVAAKLREQLQAVADGITAAKHAAVEADAWADIQDDWMADLGADGVAERDWEAIGDEWLAECNVVGVTCNENPRTLDDPGLTNFDLTIIDEVSKATPLELLMPLMRARRSTLVGDHRQLPPMFREGQDAEGLTEESDDDVPQELALTPENLKTYEKFVTASLFRTHFERADDSIKERLTVQYRMHPDIMNAVNRFYEGQLTNGISNPNDERAHGLTITGRGELPVISPDKHMVWIDTTDDDQGRPWKEPSSNSGEARTNILEARLIVRMLRDIDDILVNAGQHKDIGIVSMYQAQVRCIRQEIREEFRNRPFKAITCEVNTVVKYQGKEKAIILVSMVRNFGPRASRRRRSSRANVARYEYINVAFSRAQELLVVFGARDTFAPYQVELPPIDASGGSTFADVYKQICDVVERNGALKQARALGDLRPADRNARRR